MLFVLNMTPMYREKYTVGVPKKGKYKLLLNSDEKRFGGNGSEVPKEITSVATPCNYRDYSISVDLPPYAAMVFVF